jgi:hypothetical protein
MKNREKTKILLLLSSHRHFFEHVTCRSMVNWGSPSSGIRWHQLGSGHVIPRCAGPGRALARIGAAPSEAPGRGPQGSRQLTGLSHHRLQGASPGEVAGRPPPPYASGETAPCRRSMGKGPQVRGSPGSPGEVAGPASPACVDVGS